MLSAVFTGADGTDVSTFGFGASTGIVVLNYTIPGDPSPTGGLRFSGSGPGFAICSTALTSQAQTVTVKLGPDYRNNAFAGPIARSDGAPNGNKVWVECTLGTLYPQKRISGTVSPLGGLSSGLPVTLSGTEDVTLDVSIDDEVSIYINGALFHAFAAETLPAGLYAGIAVQGYTGTSGSAIRSWSADIIAAATAPNTPIDLVASAQTETSAHVVAEPSTTGTAPDRWQLESSATGGTGATDWAGSGTQTGAAWDVTSSGTVGTYRRVRAGKFDGSAVLWSGWFYKRVGYLNPISGGGGSLDGGGGGGGGGSTGTRRAFVPLTVDGSPAATLSVDYAILSAGRISSAPTVLASGTTTTNGDGYIDVSFASSLAAGAVVHLIVDTSGGDAESTTARMMNAPVALL